VNVEKVPTFRIAVRERTGLTLNPYPVTHLFLTD